MLEEIRGEIRKIVLEFLDSIWDKRYRMIIDGMFGVILKGNSEYFEDFINLGEFWLNGLGKQTIESQFQYTPVNIMKFKTLNNALKEVKGKRLSINQTTHREGISMLIEKVSFFWRLITENLFKAETPQKEGFLEILKFNKTIDKCLLYLFLVGNNQVNQTPNHIACIKDLVVKSEKLLELLHKNNTSEITLSDDLVDCLEKNCMILTYDLSNLLFVSPLVFTSFIDKFLSFSVIVFKNKWNDEQLQKSVSLLLYKILKNYLFHTKPQEIEEKNLQKKLKIDLAMQQTCYAAFMGFFNNEEMIQGLMSFVVSSLMIYDESSINFEVFIEDQEASGIDTVISELDCSLPKIGSVIINQFFQRFPEISLKVFYQSIDEIISQKSDVSVNLQDNLFSLISYLPKVYIYLGLDVKEIKVMPVIEYLNAQSKANIVFMRRFLIVLNNFIFIMDFEDKEKIANSIIEFIDINDEIVQFEAINCLANLIKIDHDLDLNYPQLIRLTTPIFVKMLKIIKAPCLIIKLNIYLLNLLEKTQYTVNEDVLSALNELEFDQIIEKNPKLIKPMLCDILTNLLVAFSNKQSEMIFNLAVNFIIICFRNYDKEDNNMLIRFMAITLRNMDGIEMNFNRINTLKNHFFEFFNQFIAQNDIEILINLLSIIEELALLGLNSEEFNFLSSLEFFYNKASEFDSHDSNLLKCHVFTCYTSLILIAKESGQFRIAAFEVSL